MANWVTGKVIETKYWTKELFSLRINAPIAQFKAGQFAKLALDVAGERIQRAYSYVNSPDDNTLEFYLIVVPNGQLSPSLGKLQPGDTLFITQDAAGFFVLDEIPNCRTLWMLSTGTAIGPFLSILQYGQDLDRFDNIVLIHATRYQTDLSYFPLMAALKERYAGKLHIKPIVSRENIEGILHGRIPALIANGELEQSIGLSLDASNSHVMLCGNPHMVKDTQAILTKSRRMEKHLRRKPGHITSEQYW